MGLKKYSVELATLSHSQNLRLWKPLELPLTKYSLARLLDCLGPVESGSRPEGGIDENDAEGAISLGAEQIGIDGTVDLSKIPFVPIEFYRSTNKGKVKQEDVLVCKDGALTGKTCFVDTKFPVDDVMVNEHVYIFRANENMIQRFLFYLVRSRFVQIQIQDLCYRKKGQPGFNREHLRAIKIPDIPKTKQADIIRDIASMEHRIGQLKTRIKSPQDVMNQVFAQEFAIDMQTVNIEERRKQFSIASMLTFRNRGLRSSVRWHKIAPIQKTMYKNTSSIRKLGNYILSTKNGWSPVCRESDTLNLVFGRATRALGKDHAGDRAGCSVFRRQDDAG